MSHNKDVFKDVNPKTFVESNLRYIYKLGVDFWKKRRYLDYSEIIQESVLAALEACKLFTNDDYEINLPLPVWVSQYTKYHLLSIFCPNPKTTLGGTFYHVLKSPEFFTSKTKRNRYVFWNEKLSQPAAYMLDYIITELFIENRFFKYTKIVKEVRRVMRDAGYSTKEISEAFYEIRDSWKKRC
jgi:hypothetical protein